MQATSIANHLGTTSATTISFESHVETVRIFCQTIVHTNRKALQEKNFCKALQAEFQKSGGRGRAEYQTNTGGRDDTGGRTEGCGRGDTGGGRVQGCGGQTSGHGWSQGCYHNWVPRNQFDNLSNEEYQTLIRERLTRGELQAHHGDTDPANPIPDASSTGTDVPTYPTSPAPPHSVSMAIASSNPSSTGTTTSSSMDTGPHTLFRQLMSNASTRTDHTHDTTRRDTTSPAPRCKINHVSYRITTLDRQGTYPGALMDRGANGGMARSDTRLLATMPHAPCPCRYHWHWWGCITTSPSCPMCIRG